MASPRAGGLVDVGERIVAAGIEQQDAGLARHRGQRVQDVVETHRLQRNVGFALRIDVDRHQKILAVDLQAVARIEHQRDGIGAFRRHLGREVADLGAQFVLRQIGGGQHLEAGLGQHLRHRLGVVGRIGQRNHGAVVRLADHQRDTVFGKCRVRAQQDSRGENHMANDGTDHGEPPGCQIGQSYRRRGSSPAANTAAVLLISISWRVPPAARRPRDRIFPWVRESARARPCRPSRRRPACSPRPSWSRSLGRLAWACAGMASNAIIATAIATVKVFIAGLPAIPVANLPCGAIRANPAAGDGVSGGTRFQQF